MFALNVYMFLSFYCSTTDYKYGSNSRLIHDYGYNSTSKLVPATGSVHN